jgi:hypothetical protein
MQNNHFSYREMYSNIQLTKQLGRCSIHGRQFLI